MGFFSKLFGKKKKAEPVIDYSEPTTSTVDGSDAELMDVQVDPAVLEKYNAKRPASAKVAMPKAADETKAAAPAKKAEEPKSTEPTKKAEETKAAEPAKKAEEPKSTEPDKKAEETKAAEPAKKAEEPKSTEPDKKAEEPKSTEPDKKAEETKTAEEPVKKVVVKKVVVKKPAETAPVEKATEAPAEEKPIVKKVVAKKTEDSVPAENPAEKAVEKEAVAPAADEKEEKEMSEEKKNYTGRFEINVSKNGEKYFFNLYASNNVGICTSQMYASASSALAGVNSVIKNAPTAPIEDQTLKSYDPENPMKYPKWEIYLDKGEKYRFRLNASNGSCVCHSQGYTTKNACKNGINSIIKSSADAEIDKAYLVKPSDVE